MVRFEGQLLKYEGYMSIERLIIEAKTLLGEGGLIADPALMPPYTTSMRNRHAHATPMVALPNATQQVAELVRLCRKHRFALVPQGGNTGLVDGGIPTPEGGEIIVNLSRMNRIRDIDAVGLIATVEAGVILQQLQDTVAAAGLMFPLSIASEGSAEIGGLISTNAGGQAVLRYGSMRNLVLGVEAVLPNGEIISGLKTLAKDNTGYHLASYFIGAEGTLGIVTAATLRLLPALRQKVTAVAAVPDIRAALELLASFRREGAEHLSAFEFMSLAALRLVTKNVQGTRFPCNAEDAPYYLLIELSASSELVPLRDLFESTVAAALENGKALDAVIAGSVAQDDQFWQARDHIPEALRCEKQRIHFDIALPVKSLADFLDETGARIKAEYPAIVLMPFGHLGDGNAHYNMYFPALLDDAAFAAAKARIQDIVFGEVKRWQGSISAEHGVGTERKAVLAKVTSSVELDMMRAIKRAFDPEGRMNPGKIFD
jgi:FAD/FMN-containing dehydrogenase